MWTRDDEEYLRENWANQSLKELADRFNKTIGAVSAHARKIGLPNKCAARTHCWYGHPYPQDSQAGKRLCLECFLKRQEISSKKRGKKENK